MFCCFSLTEIHLIKDVYVESFGLFFIGEQKQKAMVVSRPRDAMVTVGEDALFNCSVQHLPMDNQLVWWHRSANETRKLFEFPSLKYSSKKTSELTVNSLEKAKHDVVGQYNLLIRRANFSDEGLYTCQITGHENLSATLDVIGNIIIFIYLLYFYVFEVANLAE